MTKKILALAVVATIAVAGAWNFSQSNKELALSDVALANVEALAAGESSDEFTSATGCVACCCSSSCRGNSYAYQ